MLRSFATLVVAFLAASALASTYSLSDNYVGADFLSSWTHQNIPDPTNGRVYAITHHVQFLQ